MDNFIRIWDCGEFNKHYIVGVERESSQGVHTLSVHLSTGKTLSKTWGPYILLDDGETFMTPEQVRAEYDMQYEMLMKRLRHS